MRTIQSAYINTEDGKHIDLYAMAAFNRRAMQELLERIEQLEGRLRE